MGRLIIEPCRLSLLLGGHCSLALQGDETGVTTHDFVGDRLAVAPLGEGRDLGTQLVNKLDSVLRTVAAEWEEDLGKLAEKAPK